VHFAVDTEAVFMTTRLAGTATHFLLLTVAVMAGQKSARSEGRTYRTAYLWGGFTADSLLDLLARFLHLQVEEKRDDQGTSEEETMIFLRYHQLQAVRLLSTQPAVRVGYNYLVEHSAAEE
jgi:type I restriction enzyme R subunit